MVWTANASPELDAKSAYPTVIALTSASMFLMIVFVCVRFYVRRSRLGPDDAITAFGAATSIAFSVFVIMQTKYGLGLPISDRPPQSLDNFTLYNYAGRPFLFTTLACFKLALCLTYLRLIDRTTHRGYRRIIYAFMALLVAIGIFGIAFNIFSCTPMEKNLHPAVPGTCLPYAPWNFGIWIIHMFLDVAIFVLPIPLFMTMSIDMSLKVELSVLFSLSLLTTVFSIMKVAQVGRIAYGDHDSTQFVYLCTLEGNFGLIISCLPHLKPLWNYWKHARSTRSGNTGPSGYGYGGGTGGYQLSSLAASRKNAVKIGEGRSNSQDHILTDEGIVKTTTVVINQVPGSEPTPKDYWK